MLGPQVVAGQHAVMGNSVQQNIHITTGGGHKVH